MKREKWRNLKLAGRQEMANEIEEQLRFHLELLTEDNLKQDLSPEEARAAALKRFGDVEQIKDQCIQIKKRSDPVVRALKALLLLLFLVGVLVRVFFTELHLTRLGDLLIVIPLLGHLFLYVRSLNPSSFAPTPETSSPLRLREVVQPSIKAYDQRNLTPVERVISDK